jgi:ATP-dependent Clp protease adapter protein ClpS
MYHVYADGIAIQEAYTYDLAEYYANVLKDKFADLVVEIKQV